MEVRIGDTSGMMNIGIPSIIVKMLRQKFDQQWSVRKTQATEEEHARVLRLIRPAIIHLDARLQGPTAERERRCWNCRKATFWRSTIRWTSGGRDGERKVEVSRRSGDDGAQAGVRGAGVHHGALSLSSGSLEMTRAPRSNVTY